MFSLSNLGWWEIRAHRPSLMSGLILSVSSSAVTAQTITFTGDTGILGTPTARIAAPGKFTYQYNNFIEPRFVDANDSGNNHVFALGIYPRFEIGGRLTDFSPAGEKYDSQGRLRGKRDLSGNAKFNFFKIPNRFWLSIGARDFGGLAQNFSSTYAVASTKWRNGLFSAGYSTGDNDSFSGSFLNAQYAVNQYLTVAVEKDTENSVNAGLTASVPITPKFSISATLSSSENDARLGIGATYQIGASDKIHTQVTQQPLDNVDAVEITNKFAEALASEQFQHIKVGHRDNDHYIVHLENRLYTHSDHDALSQIIKIAQQTLPKQSTLDITLLDQRIPKFRISVNLTNDATDDVNTTHSTKTRSSESIILAAATFLPPLTSPIEQSETQWISSPGAINRTYLDLNVSPALVSAIGTEYGTIDYSLAARLGVSVPLWPGAQAVVNGFVPLSNTFNFDEGRPFGDRTLSSSLERAVLLQYFPPFMEVYSQLEVGQIQARGFDYSAAKVQAAWQSSRFPVLVHARAGKYNLENTDVERTVVLGTLSYTMNQWDTVLDGTYGQFLLGEQAVKITATRRFGNSYVGMFVKIIDEDDLAGGLSLSTPIGPRRGLQWKGLSLTGTARWSHRLQTTIKNPFDGSNRLRTGFVFEPLTDSELPVRLLDSGRLNSHFIRHNR